MEDVCDLLERLNGLNPAQVKAYQSSIRDNNISGLVLTMCDMLDLQPIINMKFGDWQLFRSAFESLKGYELQSSSPSNELAMASSSTYSSQASCISNSTLVDSPTNRTRSQSIQSTASGIQPQDPRGELQKMRALRMRRNDSIAQQLSYETAILRSAVSEFVEESDEEEDEVALEVVLGTDAAETPKCDEKVIEWSFGPTRPTLTFKNELSTEASLSEESKRPSSEMTVSTEISSRISVSEPAAVIPQSKADDSATLSSKSKEMETYVISGAREDLSTATVSGIDSLTSCKSEKNAPAESLSSVMSMKDIMPFVTVLDQPMSYAQGSSEFIPLLDNMEKTSLPDSSGFINGKPSTSSSTDHSMDSGIAAGKYAPRYSKHLPNTNTSNISGSYPKLNSSQAQVMSLKLTREVSDRIPMTSLEQMHAQKHTYGSQDYSHSTLDRGSSSSSTSQSHAPLPLDSFAIAMPKMKGNAPQQGSPLRMLTSSIDRMTRPLFYQHSYEDVSAASPQSLSPPRSESLIPQDPQLTSFHQGDTIVEINAPAVPSTTTIVSTPESHYPVDAVVSSTDTQVKIAGSSSSPTSESKV